MAEQATSSNSEKLTFNRRDVLAWAGAAATMGAAQVMATPASSAFRVSEKGVLAITMSGCPALAAPAGFNDQGLPIGIQIIGPNHAELSCLQLAYAYDTATAWPSRRPPALLNQS
jgi:Asp-tRNA(Asn)/Glu-tRNA(Gln) amidotransferase A subunit family amidase